MNRRASKARNPSQATAATESSKRVSRLNTLQADSWRCSSMAKGSSSIALAGADAQHRVERTGRHEPGDQGEHAHIAPSADRVGEGERQQQEAQADAQGAVQASDI